VNAGDRLVSTVAAVDIGQRIRTIAMARQAALVFVSTLFLNAGGFVFHAIASRSLGVATYGQLYALISACTIVVLPIGLASPVIARFAAEFAVLHDRSHVRAMTVDVGRFFGLVGIAGIVLAAALARPIGAFLHLPAWTIPAIAGISAFTLLNAGFRAIAVGTQDFATFAGSVCAEGAGKVIALVALLSFGFGLAGGVAGFAAGALAGFIVIAALFVRCYANVAARSIRYDWKRIAISGVGAAALTITVTLVGNADVLVVKHFFSAAQAGLYSAAALGGKIVFYFIGFIPTILLPQVTERHVRGERTRHALVLALILFAVIAAGGVVGVKLFGLLLLHVLVGHAFDAAHGLLVGYTIAMLLLALISLFAYYGIATHRLAFALPLLAGTGITLLSVLVFHTSLEQVVEALVAGMGVTALFVAGALGWQGWQSTRCAPS
jgi:O-antigen/teichoic acid export membrane protein